MSALGVRPRCACDLSGKTAHNVIPIASAGNLTRRTVLLAWSPGSERDALVGGLEQRGHRVRVADDAVAALGLIDSASWYAVVLEDDLPDGGGLWVAKVLAFVDVARADSQGPMLLAAHRAHVDEDEWRATAVSPRLDKPVTAVAIGAALARARARLGVRA